MKLSDLISDSNINLNNATDEEKDFFFKNTYILGICSLIMFICFSLEIADGFLNIFISLLCVIIGFIIAITLAKILINNYKIVNVIREAIITVLAIATIYVSKDTFTINTTIMMISYCVRMNAALNILIWTKERKG